MIYNIAIVVDMKQKFTESTSKQIIYSNKILINTLSSVENIIEEMYEEYYYFDKIHQYFGIIYKFSIQNYVYRRSINGKNQLLAINVENDKINTLLLFLLEKKRNNLEALKEEILDIKKACKVKNKKITIFGSLKQEEIRELEMLGVEFEIPIETDGYMLNIK